MMLQFLKAPLQRGFLLVTFKRKMFFFSRKKEIIPVVKDVVWRNEQEKFAGLIGLARANHEVLFLFWFDETGERLSLAFQNGSVPAERLADAKTLRHFEAQGRPVLFVEHFPLRLKEEGLYSDLKLAEAVVHTALDEPFMKLFGGDNTVRLLDKMGYRKGESLTHSLISISIKKAQDKLGKRTLVEQPGRSQADWLKRNALS